MEKPNQEANSAPRISYDGNPNVSLKYCKFLKDTLNPLFTQRFTEFFGTNVVVFVAGVSDKPLYFWKENDFFVTQASITNICSIQIRVSNTASGILLDESLGRRDDNELYFKFKNITRFETEVLTHFTEFLFKQLNAIFLEKRKIERIKEPPKDLIHLTLLVNTPERLKANKPCGKIVLSMPQNILIIPDLSEIDFEVDMKPYLEAVIETNVFVGTAIINLDDLKKIGPNDVIILDNSDLEKMRVFNDRYIMPFRVRPDQNIVLNIHSEEYNDMGNELLDNQEAKQQIWDSIQVEVGAEFKKIKLPLGELRKMTEGLVVEVASLVDNEIRLHIDGKDLAFGELVIVGDKYGVMINKVIHKQLPEAPQEEPEEIIQDTEDFVETNLEEDDDEYNYDDLGLDDEF